MYYLGIDYGTKKMGIAILESDSGITSPLPLVLNNDRLFDALHTIIQQYHITTILLGLPSYESTAKKVHRFAEKIRNRYDITISFVPEDNSSIAVRQTLTSKKQKSNLDSYSAVALCEQWYTEQNKLN